MQHCWQNSRLGRKRKGLSWLYRVDTDAALKTANLQAFNCCPAHEAPNRKSYSGTTGTTYPCFYPLANRRYACNHDEEVTQKCKYTCGKCGTCSFLCVWCTSCRDFWFPSMTQPSISGRALFGVWGFGLWVVEDTVRGMGCLSRGAPRRPRQSPGREPRRRIHHTSEKPEAMYRKP